MTQSLPKLLWLVEHEPEVIRSAARIVDVHAFLVHRLTGDWLTSLAQRRPDGYRRHGSRRLGRGPDRANRSPPSAVLPARAARRGPWAVNEEAAAATGLRAGTPVVAGAGDGQAACLGAGVTGPGRAFVNLGTAIAGGAASDRLPDRPRLPDLLRRPFPARSSSNRCCAAAPRRSAGSWTTSPTRARALSAFDAYEREADGRCSRARAG